MLMTKLFASMDVTMVQVSPTKICSLAAVGTINIPIICLRTTNCIYELSAESYNKHKNKFDNVGKLDQSLS